jgi:ATP-dependent Clp protease ATP-binding subunit ClpB
MSFENFTVKSQQALQKALEIATAKQNQAIEPVHLLKAMLLVDDNAVPYLLKAHNVNTDYLTNQLDKQIDTLPKVVGGEHYLSANTNKVIQKAQQHAQESQDKYVSIEQLLLAILSLNEGASRLLQSCGVTEKGLKEAIKQLRKGSTVNTQTTDETYNALNRFATNLNERAKTGKLDPVIGRDEEIRRVLQILSRRTKNNPILIGEPAVGKTAIPRHSSPHSKRDVPENLKSKADLLVGYGCVDCGCEV